MKGVVNTSWRLSPGGSLTGRGDGLQHSPPARPPQALPSCSLPAPAAHIKVGTPSPSLLPEWVQVITPGSLKLLMDRQ